MKNGLQRLGVFSLSAFSFMAMSSVALAQTATTVTAAPSSEVKLPYSSREAGAYVLDRHSTLPAPGVLELGNHDLVVRVAEDGSFYGVWPLGILNDGSAKAVTNRHEMQLGSMEWDSQLSNESRERAEKLTLFGRKPVTKGVRFFIRQNSLQLPFAQMVDFNVEKDSSGNVSLKDQRKYSKMEVGQYGSLLGRIETNREKNAKFKGVFIGVDAQKNQVIFNMMPEARQVFCLTENGEATLNYVYDENKEELELHKSGGKDPTGFDDCLFTSNPTGTKLRGTVNGNQIEFNRASAQDLAKLSSADMKSLADNEASVDRARKDRMAKVKARSMQGGAKGRQSF